MTKQEAIKILNSGSISNETLMSILTEYLYDIKYEKTKEMLQFFAINPDFLSITWNTLSKYLCRKYYIFSLIYNNQIILYYE